MRPTLMINPTSDETFKRATRSASDEAAGDIRDAQRRLRRSYPRAVIRARDLAGESIVVWYVYREGVWVSG